MKHQKNVVLEKIPLKERKMSETVTAARFRLLECSYAPFWTSFHKGTVTPTQLQDPAITDVVERKEIFSLLEDF